VTQPAGTIFVLRSSDLTGAVIRLVTHSRVNHAGVCFGGGTIEAKLRGAVTGREHTGALYGTRLLAEMERQRPGVGADVAAAALRLLGTSYGFVDIAALGLADLGCASDGWSGSWTASTLWSAHSSSTKRA